MKKFSTFYFLFSIFLLSMPFVSSAVVVSPGVPYWGPFVKCSDAGCGFDDLVQTFLNIIYFGITISLFFAAPILFAWGGIMILISGGNPGQIENGKKILTGTLWGVVIVLLAYLIVKVFVYFLGIKGTEGFG